MKTLVLVFLLVAAPVAAQVPQDFHGWFLSQVAGKPFGQQTLLDLAPLLPCVGSQITPPNAVGERTKIWEPNAHEWKRVGFGDRDESGNLVGWVWVGQGVTTQPEPQRCGSAPDPSPDPLPVLVIDYARIQAIVAAEVHAEVGADRAEGDTVYQQNERTFNNLSGQLKAHDDKQNEILAFLTNAKTIVAEVGVIVGWALEHYVINPAPK